MSSDDIATVNPMTTQLGSHISCYPGLGTQFLGDLEVDDEELDSITNEMNRQRFIPVHVTVGFCMYIRRQCLNEIGYFDSINFPIAYGEESDFCYRARKARWRHMIAGDVFVTHLEGRSFSDRKQQLMNDMFKRFIVLHPETPEFDQRFLRQDPLRILRAGIDIGRIRRLLGGKDVIALARDDAAPSRTRRPWLSFNPETYLTKIVVPDVPEQSLPNVDQFRLPLDNLKLSQTLARLGVNSLICSSENLANSFELARKVAHPEEINLNIAVRVGVNF
jgi:hypothetical protein